MIYQSFFYLLLLCVVGLGSITTISARVSSPLQSDSRLPLSTRNGDGSPPISSSYPDSNSSYPEVHPSLVRRHNQFLSILHRLSPSDGHTKRSLATVLATGIHFFFDHFDIVVATVIEANYMSDFYREMIANLSPERCLQRERMMAFGDPAVIPIVLQYGFVKLVVGYARQEGLTDEMMENAVLQFATIMVEVTRYVGVVLPFQVWALVNGAWVLIRAFIEGFEGDIP